jgi:hypothetical protein
MRKLLEGKRDMLCVECEKRIPLWDRLEELFSSPEILEKVRQLQEQSSRELSKGNPGARPRRRCHLHGRPRRSNLPRIRRKQQRRRRSVQRRRGNPRPRPLHLNPAPTSPLADRVQSQSSRHRKSGGSPQPPDALSPGRTQSATTCGRPRWRIGP